MNTPSILVGALVCSVIGGVVAGYVGVKLLPSSITELDSNYVYTFDKDQLVDPKDPQAFKDALSKDKVTFRHRMGIYDAQGNCDQKGLEDTGVVGIPKPCKPQHEMGQQVTQRVGFNSRTNLEAALKLVGK